MTTLAADSPGSFLLTIQNNVFLHASNTPYVINIYQRASVLVKNNFIGCLSDGTVFCTHVPARAVSIDINPVNSSSHSITFSGNTIHGSTNAVDIVIVDTVVDSNMIYQSCTPQSSPTKGVWATSQSTVNNNLIKGFDMGVEIDGTGNMVSSNQLTGNQQGVYLQSSGNIVQKNIIESNTKAGIVSDIPQWNRYTENRIFNNTDLGIHLGNLASTNVPNPIPVSPALPPAPNVTMLSYCGSLVKIEASVQLSSSVQWVLFEVFLNDACDPSGYGEGVYSLGYLPPMQPDSGFYAVSVGELDATTAMAALGTNPLSCFLTATVTFVSGNTTTPSFSDSTSEFGLCSVCTPVGVSCPPSPTSSVTSSISPSLSVIIVSNSTSFTPSMSASSTSTPSPRGSTPRSSPTSSSSQQKITTTTGDTLLALTPETQEIVITKQNQHDTIVIPLISSSSDKVLLGQIVIPGGVFPVGAVIKIRSRTDIGEQFFQDNNNDDDPCKPQQFVTRLSPVIDIRVENGPNKDFKKDVDIQLAGGDEKGACMGYSESDRIDFRCLPSTEKKRRLTSQTTLYSSKTDHFTTFAVLLFGGYTDPCDRWIWPTSIAALGVSIVIGILVGLLIRNHRFRAFVHGYNVKRSVSHIVGRVQRQQTDQTMMAPSSAVIRSEGSTISLGHP